MERQGICSGLSKRTGVTIEKVFGNYQRVMEVSTKVSIGDFKGHPRFRRFPWLKEPYGLE